MNKVFSKLTTVILKYRLRLLGAVFGLIAGWWGGLVGFLLGVICETILLRRKEEKKITDYFHNPAGKKIAEPFSGAAVTCAIAVLCCRDRNFVERQAKICFSFLSFDGWHSFCVAALKEAVEIDLLTEILASKLRHVKDTAILEGVFRLLQAVEFGWDNKTMGDRPTVYLSQLLNYSFYADDYAAACSILGVDKDASFKSIKGRYRRLMIMYHPDTIVHLSDNQKTNAFDMFLRIQKAFEIISERYKS